VGAAFFLSSSPAYQLVGALLFLAHSILDGCDGELARLKFMESPHGAILDFWGDNVVHVGVFGCMAVGLSHAQAAVWPLALGAITIVATLGAAASQSRAFMLDTTVGADAAWIARFAEAFSHRDFIYLIIALAAFGRAHVFLILTSIGTPIFFGLLLWVGARRRA
jgi:phosphatidylglycerophosphate synthase